MELQPSAQDNPTPSKKRRRDATATDIVAIEDNKDIKRRKKAGQGALAEGIRPIPSVQRPEQAIKDTLRGENKKSKNQKDGRKIEELIAQVCLLKH